MNNSAKYLQFGLSTLLIMVVWVIALALLYTGSDEGGYGPRLYSFATVFGYLFLATGAILLMIRLLNNPSLQNAFAYNVTGMANILVGITYCITYILLKTDHFHWDFLLNLGLGTVFVIDIILS